MTVPRQNQGLKPKFPAWSKLGPVYISALPLVQNNDNFRLVTDVLDFWFEFEIPA